MSPRLAVPGLLLAALLALTPSCAHSPEPGVVHTVRAGENLYRIARYYGVPLDRLVRANRVADVRELRPGRRIFVPGAHRAPPSSALRPPDDGRAAVSASRKALARAGLSFAWPVRGTLTSRFGWRSGRRHEGIDVARPKGTPVRAAETGRVIYSGSGLGAYGNVVIVRHAGSFATVYAHNRRNHVRKGARVAKGQLLAELGATGNATGPHLHFEIRRHDRAENPLQYLP